MEVKIWGLGSIYTQGGGVADAFVCTLNCIAFCGEWRW